MQLTHRVQMIGKKDMIVVALLSCLYLAGCNGHEKSSAPPPVPEVGVVTIQQQKVTLTTELPGRTIAFRVAEIRPQVNGLIQKRLFTEGGNVKEGQLLYQIDPAPFQAALDNAEAALNRSEANLLATRLKAERFRELLADKAVSRQDYDDAAAALKQTEADIQYWKAMVDTARINLKYTAVTAPISGRIGRSSVTEGALVTAYQPVALATIQQMDPLYVDVPQSTAELLRLKRRIESGTLSQDGTGQKRVRLLLEDGAVYPSEGTLQFRDVTVDQTTGTVTLRVVFPNPDGILLPGMFVRAVVREGVNEAAILVPQQAVLRDPKGNPYALVVDSKDTVEQRQITIDRAMGDQWLVTSGLAAGDRIVVEEIQRVAHGMSVKTQPAAVGGGRESGEHNNAGLPPTQSN
ncbi:MAG: efflux RND transporter periplasmic adaptor subunit [Deltaproteobacteria bacterium]|nr:efflux RND transporter periplasmic adaptor subunit [Deltaproteobacteria bacterium]